MAPVTTGSSIVPDSFPLNNQFDNWIPGVGASFRTKYILNNPKGPRWYRNVHLIPPQTIAPAATSTLSPPPGVATFDSLPATAHSRSHSVSPPYPLRAHRNYTLRTVRRARGLGKFRRPPTTMWTCWTQRIPGARTGTITRLTTVSPSPQLKASQDVSALSRTCLALTDPLTITIRRTHSPKRAPEAGRQVHRDQAEARLRRPRRSPNQRLPFISPNRPHPHPQFLARGAKGRFQGSNASFQVHRPRTGTRRRMHRVCATCFLT